jgi:hypothetical protein
MKSENIIRLAVIGVITAVTGGIIWKSVKSSRNKLRTTENQSERSEATSEEVDNRPESVALSPTEEGEIRTSYDLEKFQQDTFQIGYEITKLINEEFGNDLIEGKDFDRYDGTKPDDKYCEIRFDGRYRANIIFHQFEESEGIEDEVNELFYSVYMKEIKAERVKASLSVNKHIVIDKGTYKSFADLALNRVESQETITGIKISLGRIRMEDLIYMMMLLRNYGYKSILMY